ncbi:MAG: PIG-L family deacetylase [Candidatus Dormibacteraeota bacterium]|nr:PIG-L family deacetylase [Candidatus Dormibacteraeota bacterium]
MAVHAHPDDETITMGGTLALLGDRGVATSVVCCTDGKLATIVADDMPEETTRPRLAEIREAELKEACRILGVSEVNFLGFGDSGMAGEATNQMSGAFWTTPIDDAVRVLVGHMRRFRPHVVLTYDANGGYGHPDHIQTHRVALLATEASGSPLYPDEGDHWRISKLYYSAFPVSWARRISEFAKQAGMEPPFGMEDPDQLPFLTPDELVTTKVDARAAIPRFRAALRAHHSQIGEDWPQLTLPEEVVGEFAYEHYQLVISRVRVSLPETDVLTGIESETEG